MFKNMLTRVKQTVKGLWDKTYSVVARSYYAFVNAATTAFKLLVASVLAVVVAMLKVINELVADLRSVVELTGEAGIGYSSAEWVIVNRQCTSSEIATMRSHLRDAWRASLISALRMRRKLWRGIKALPSTVSSTALRAWDAILNLLSGKGHGSVVRTIVASSIVFLMSVSVGFVYGLIATATGFVAMLTSVALFLLVGVVTGVGYYLFRKYGPQFVRESNIWAYVAAIFVSLAVFASPVGSLVIAPLAGLHWLASSYILTAVQLAAAAVTLKVGQLIYNHERVRGFIDSWQQESPMVIDAVASRKDSAAKPEYKPAVVSGGKRGQLENKLFGQPVTVVGR